MSRYNFGRSRSNVSRVAETLHTFSSGGIARLLTSIAMVIATIVLLILNKTWFSLAISIGTLVMFVLYKIFSKDDSLAGEIASFIEIILSVIGLAISIGILVFPSWGNWAMIFTGAVIGIANIAFMFVYIYDLELFGSTALLVLQIIAAGILTFINSTTSFVALALVITAGLYLAILAYILYDDCEEELAVGYGIGGGIVLVVLLILSIINCCK